MHHGRDQWRSARLAGRYTYWASIASAVHCLATAVYTVIYLHGGIMPSSLAGTNLFFYMVKFAPEGLQREDGPFTNPVKIMCKKNDFRYVCEHHFPSWNAPTPLFPRHNLLCSPHPRFSLFYPSFSEPVMSRAEPLEKHIVTRRPSDRMNVSLQINYFNWNRYGSATSNSWHPQRPRTVCIF